MGLESVIERIGEDWALAGAGLVIGLAFGFLARRSRFCLRSVLSGPVFAVTAQAAWTRALSPLWLAIARGWTVDGGAARDLAARITSTRPCPATPGPMRRRPHWRHAAPPTTDPRALHP